ncbi:MAG: metal-dependent hydrolase [Armatimonadetes bacterium]|nr:metal-dependent hydrolase [Armatimonadota bacterium]
MPQNGLHGLVGLAAAKQLAPLAPREEAVPFVTAITLGAMLPDIDMYPTAVVFLSGREDLVYAVHRTLAHSLWVLLLLIGAGAVARERWKTGRWICWGLALGGFTHVFLDAFFWFAPLDLFWPLSRLPPDRPLLPVIHLWSGMRLPALWGKPDLLENSLMAFELAALALYLLALRRISRQVNPRCPAAEGLIRWERWAWISFGISFVGAVVLPSSAQKVLVHVPYLLAFLPYCWWQTVKRRETIATWSLRES